jgi:cytochrome c553
MKIAHTIGLSAAVIAALVVCGSVRAAEKGAQAYSVKDLQAKLEYCKTCHGLNGQGYRGSLPMPRLAGQQTEYFENQLRAFIEKRRENRFMFPVAHALDPAMLSALAEHFKGLNPKPLDRGAKALAAKGQQIFTEGVPNAEIPPCAACHGPEAKGDGVFPRLAGQLPDYIFRKLVNWSKERGQDPKNPDTSAVMEPIAHNLTQPQITAVAAYLSGLE